MKWKRLTNREMLNLLKKGQYSTNIETGEVFNKHKKKLKGFKGRNAEHLFVTLFDGDKRRTIGIGRLVWMDATRSTIPTNWEVHHCDEDPTNNAFSNLICLHPIDHRKFHEPEDEEEIPF